MSVHVCRGRGWGCCSCGHYLCEWCFKAHDCLTLRPGVTAVPRP